MLQWNCKEITKITCKHYLSLQISLEKWRERERKLIQEKTQTTITQNANKKDKTARRKKRLPRRFVFALKAAAVVGLGGVLQVVRVGRCEAADAGLLHPRRQAQPGQAAVAVEWLWGKENENEN